MNDHEHCHDLLETISEYLDGDLSPELCSELERHLCDCQHCRVVVDTMKKTIELYQETSSDVSLPEDVHERLFARLHLEDFQHHKSSI